MTRLPHATEYQMAVQVPQVAFSDPTLKSSQVIRNQQQIPLPASGGFAITYKFTGPSGTWAVRCFHKYVPDLQERYREISNFLNARQDKYFVHVDYQTAGILINGSRYPVTKMQWVAGKPLNDFIESNINQPNVIKPLASRFAAMVYHLEQIGVAHGDLQHGNILVVNSDFRLIDYDGMFVPALRGRNSNEIGHPNYQHPLRRATDFNAHLDRFSSLVIYLALSALTEKPKLWAQYGQGGENLLFLARDFDDPVRSPLFQELQQIPSLSRMVYDFAKICKASLSQVPSLSDFIVGNTKSIQTVAPNAAPQPIAYRSAYDVISATERGRLLERMGDRITVVGRIVGVHQRRTKYNALCAFLNFGNYHYGDFYLAIWSDALKLFRERYSDLNSYTNQWVSVTGVIEEYNGKSYITIGKPSEIELLSGEREANWRLGRGAVATQPSTATSQQIQQPLKQGSTNPGTPQPSKPIPPQAPPPIIQERDKNKILFDLYSDRTTKPLQKGNSVPPTPIPHPPSPPPSSVMPANPPPLQKGSLPPPTSTLQPPSQPPIPVLAPRPSAGTQPNQPSIPEHQVKLPQNQLSTPPPTPLSSKPKTSMWQRFLRWLHGD